MIYFPWATNTNTRNTNSTPESLLPVGDKAKLDQMTTPSTSVARNFITELPRAAVKVGGDIFHSITRDFASVAMTIQEMYGGSGVYRPSGKKTAFDNFLFGNEPIKSLDKRIIEAIPKTQQIGAQLGVRLNGPQAALLAGPLIIGSTALNFTGWGGESKGAISALTVANKEGDVLKILKNIGVADDLAKEYAPIIKNTFREKTVKAIIDHIAEIQDVTKTVTHYPISKTLQEAAKVPELNSEEAVINALQQAKKIRPLQERLYTAARGEKFSAAEQAGMEAGGGEKGLYAELKKLQGNLPKFQFEAIRNRIGQDTIDNLFKQITSSPQLTYIETVPARQALLKLIDKGAVPTAYERGLLEKVFSKRFMETVSGEADMFSKFKEAGAQLVNLPRTLMASMDLSAPLRQGVYVLPRHPIMFGKDFAEMFKYFGSEKAYNGAMEAITKGANFDLMRGRVAFTNLGEKLAQREERFMGSWAEKIPVAGQGVKASERAYTGFLNKLRSDLFDDLVTKMDNLGFDLRDGSEQSKQLLNSMAEHVNKWTGRGKLPKSWEPAAPILNGVVFSPRLMASRLNILTDFLNPYYYARTPKVMRVEALKNLFAFAGAATSILGLAKLGGAEVEADPRSSDFGKIKIGNTRLDIMGGFSQYIRLAAQMFTNQYKSSTGTGVITRLGERLPGYTAPTRIDKLFEFGQAKEAPIFSLITDLLRGTDVTGQPVSVPNAVLERLNPLIFQDIYDLARQNPKLLPAAALGVFGVGVQTYSPTVRYKGQVLPWSQSTKTFQYNQDTVNEINRFKQRIEEAVKAGDRKKAQKEQENLQRFMKERAKPPH